MPTPRKKLPSHTAAETVPISARLTALRKLRGLTQIELAEKIGISRDLLSNYEQGRTHLTDDVIIKLAKALRISTDELLGLVDGQNSEAEKVSLRFLKRLTVIEKFPEAKKKRILRNLDDAIEANTSM